MYKKIIMGTAIVLIAVGCATQPKKEEAKKLIPKDMNGTTTTTITSTGAVYASQKNNYLNSCLHGNGQGCRDISTLYELGVGVPKNMKKALYYIEKGCELNHGASCSRVGNFYEYGMAGVINKQKAATYYMKGCELNYGTACNNIGTAYMDGEGVVKNLALSETYLQKALKLGHNTYNNLGFLYEMKGDDVKAEEHYIKGCDLKDALACSNLANLYKSQKKYTPAYNHYIKACNLANGSACQRSAMMIYDKLITVPTPNATMFRLESNSCELNYKTGCADLAYLYENGMGVAKDKKKAKKYYKKACKLGHKSSCNK